MIGLLVLTVALVSLCIGLVFGLTVGQTRTQDALKRARYLEAIALADDLIKTPDALDLRDRAEKLLAAHRAAYPRKDT